MTSSRLKPLARAIRLRPVVTRTRSSLSRDFEELIFRHAQVLSEGYCHHISDLDAMYTGSTMLTVDLERMGPAIAHAWSRSNARLLHSVMEGSVRLRVRSMRLALAEAARRCVHGQLGMAHVETRIRIEGTLVHVDVDVEAPVFLHAIKRRKG